MSERIRVEITEHMGSSKTTYAAEALSGTDAVNACIDALNEYDEYVEELEDG